MCRGVFAPSCRPRRTKRKGDAPPDGTGLTSAVERDRCKEHGIAALLEEQRGERAGLNERDESQSTRYGRERDGGSWKREEWNRAQLGESRWQGGKGRKARMGERRDTQVRKGRTKNKTKESKEGKKAGIQAVRLKGDGTMRAGKREREQRCG